MAEMIDYSGERFGRLLVKSMTKLPGKPVRVMAICICDCGKEKMVRGTHLLSGRIRSCGCLRDEMSKERTTLLHRSGTMMNKTHGGSKTTLYKRWMGMKARCYNSNHMAHKDYGGRGIKVCDRWLESFQNFYDDMGDPPPGCSIDRIDNNGDYTPENCQWATREDQSNNLRKNRIIEYNGERHSVTMWSRILGIHQSTLDERLRSGWKIADALDARLKSKRKYAYKGENLSANEICKKYDMNLNTLNCRLRAGWTVDQAIETPVMRKK